jgi:thymidylate kinase
MATVAIIGPDGAGKTSVARWLEAAGPIPIKYLYMGINTSSSNVALPTSRLVEWLRRRWGRARTEGGAPEHGQPSTAARGRSPGAGWRTARLFNRLAEAWFRQTISWFWEWRGYTVVYDRHFLFDFAEQVATPGDETLDRRIHRWFLTHLYPRPDMVMLLDAPGSVLFERKREATPEELERRRQAMLEVGRTMSAFVAVDATRPLDQVRREVAGWVLRVAPDPHRGRPAGRGVRT